MTRLVAAGLILCSYFEIRQALPLLASRAPNRGVNLAVSTLLWASFGTEVLIYAILLLVPLIARAYPSLVHFGSRRLSDYSPSQLDRVLPVLKSMVGMLCCAVTLTLGLEIHLRIRYALVDFRKQPPTLALYGLMLVSFLLITWYNVQKMDEAARRH